MDDVIELSGRVTFDIQGVLTPWMLAEVVNNLPEFGSESVVVNGKLVICSKVGDNKYKVVKYED